LKATSGYKATESFCNRNRQKRFRSEGKKSERCSLEHHWESYTHFQVNQLIKEEKLSREEKKRRGRHHIQTPLRVEKQANTWSRWQSRPLTWQGSLGCTLKKNGNRTSTGEYFNDINKTKYRQHIREEGKKLKGGVALIDT